MKGLDRLSVGHRAIGRLKQLRRDARDALVLSGIALIAFAFSFYYDLPLTWFQLALDNEDWHVDDIIFVAMVLGVLLIFYGFRRYQDFSREIKARRSAELEARNLARHDP